jgi:hypothetical protein
VGPAASLGLATLALSACSGADASKLTGNADAANGSMDGEAMDASATDSSGGSPDAAPPDVTTCSPSENDAGTCSSIDPSGPMITAMCSMAEPPQAQGGTVEDGTYVLAAVTHYGSCPTSLDVASTTWVICGNHWDVAQVTPLNPTADAGLAPVLRLNFLAAIQGTSIDFTLACGTSNGGVTMRGYTSSGGHLWFVYTVNTDVVVSEYTKQ